MSEQINIDKERYVMNYVELLSAVKFKIKPIKLNASFCSVCV